MDGATESTATETWVLPNRRAFAQSLTQRFLKWLPQTQAELKSLPNVEEDACAVGDLTQGEIALLPYQSLIRDYLSNETPYRGLLLMHGLGSGKTLTSLSVALSMIEERSVWVFLPATLHAGWTKEFMTKGKPLWAYGQHWVKKESEDSISHWIAKDGEPNYASLDPTSRSEIDATLQTLLETRFKFVHYNDPTLSSKLVEMLDLKTDEEGNTVRGQNPFANSTVLIDEMQQFVSMVFEKDEDVPRKLAPLYEALYEAPNLKIIGLSATPLTNDPYEIVSLLNLLRGPQTALRLNPPPLGLDVKPFLHKLDSVDVAEWLGPERVWILTRNPPHFITRWDASGTTIGVVWDEKRNGGSDAVWKEEIVATLKLKGWDVGDPALEKLSLFPQSKKEWEELYLDKVKGTIKNPLLFQRRIQGLVSYFAGGSTVGGKMAQRVGLEDTLTLVPLSHPQFVQYALDRREELREESQRAKFGREDTPSSYRSKTRRDCTFVLPPTLKGGDDVLAQLEKSSAEFLSPEGLDTWGPKLRAVLENVQKRKGNQVVYSAFRDRGWGVGVMGLVLKQAGFWPYGVRRVGGEWVPDVGEGAKPPFYLYYTGEEGPERELYRGLFNGDPDVRKEAPRVWDHVQQWGDSNVRGELFPVLFLTRAGAAGINLRNVRDVHILEPHWNPALLQQVVGRAIRICSHSDLPLSERTVGVHIYLSVFGDDITRISENNVALLRKQDTVLKHYRAEFQPTLAPVLEAATTDEQMMELSYGKKIFIDQLIDLLRASAIDCAIHATGWASQTPIVPCMRWDGEGGPLIAHPTPEADVRDEEVLLNQTVRKHTFRRIRLYNHLFLQEGTDLYDARVWEATRLLVPVGTLVDTTLTLF